MGHYASEMADLSPSSRAFEAWLRIRNENQYTSIAYDIDRDAEDTLVHHTPCGLVVANMVLHLDLCPANQT